MFASLRFAGCFAISGAVAAGAVAFLAVGCSSSEDAGANSFSGDGGGPDAAVDGGGLDGSLSDSGLRPPPHLVVVHASPALFPFRVCLEDSPTSSGSGHPRSVAPWPDDPSHPAPMSNYPAVALGSGALWSNVGSATSSYVVPYVLDAQQLANSSGDGAKTCDALVCNGGSCLEQNNGWIALDGIDATTFSSSRAILLAVTGCPQGTGSAAQCGAGYDPVGGNLHATWIALSDSTGTDDAFAQLAQLSPNFGAATVTSVYADDASLASALPYLSIAPPASLPVPSPSMLGAYAVDTLTAMGDAGALTLSLADITRLTDPSLLPSDLFAPASNILIGIVGDPSSTVAQVDAGGDASYDGHGLHMIAVPMNPAPDAGM